tara:strand:- start:200 stop:568 length:369 start_codon:yes stop_codon:yes gene_type:complete
MMAYTWGDSTSEGIYFNSKALTHLSDAYELGVRLEDSNYELVTMCEAGVIIKHAPVYSSEKIKEMDLVIANIAGDLVKLLEKQEIADVVIEPIKKDITSEFFILFDFLPEHIKKELKIYVKK